ncbi:MAG TPA: hypothetical protein VGL59_00260 [Polyangia bacterium]|jgi:hypothetical protein
MKQTALIVMLGVGVIGALGCGATKEAAADGPGPSANAGVDGGVEVAQAEVSGRWAMFAFEDPVAVEIVQSGNILTGTGCYGGLPVASDPPDSMTAQFCVPLQGSVEGRHVQFALGSRDVPYAADVYASADGQRMAGRFHDTGDWSAAFAWLRIGPSDRWLSPATTTALMQALAQQAGHFILQPVGIPPAAIELLRGEYFLGLITEDRGPQLAGTLGSFWATEMTWDATQQTLTAGPVPVSSAATPIKLVLHFNGATLSTCEATMPGGDLFAFTATRQTN